MEDNGSSLAQHARPPEQQRRIFLLLVFIACAVLAIGWLGSGLFGHHSTGEPPAAAANGTFRVTDAQLATLKVESVATARFRSELATDGKIALNLDTATPVFSPYSGRVTRLIAGIGDYVKRGAPLFAIEATEFGQAEADLANSIAQLELARVGEQRKHAAYDSKGGSLQDWQQAQADLAAARSANAQVRNRLQILGKTDAEIDALGSRGRADPVTYVVAPISGVVADRQLGPGQYVQAGAATPAYTIGDLSTVWLVANVREVDAPLVQRGQTMEVSALALPGEIFKATLTSIGSQVDPATRRVPVRATLDNRAGKLKPEMFASFSIVTSGESTAPAVPADAIVYEGAAARVWVLGSGNSLAMRLIHTGRTSAGLVEVLGGLNAGEKIVTRGSLFIDRAATPD